MRLTTKGRYAVTAVLDLALHQSRGPVSLADVSARQEISLSYLEQLFAKLRRRGLVQSVRGPGGGYLLGRPAGEISVAAVVDAVNESYEATGCAGGGKCRPGEPCLAHVLWDRLSDQIHVFLSGITVEHLMSQRNVQRVAARQDELDARLAGRRGSGDIDLRVVQ